MSTIIMNACWPIQGMSASQKAVLISLADNANDEGYCWPSVDTIASRTCLSARSVQTAIRWLCDHGALHIIERSGRSNMYQLTPAEFAPLQDLRGEKNVDTPEKNVKTPAGFAPAPAAAAPRTTNNHHRTTIEPPKGKRGANKIDVELPGWLPDDVWQDWVDHRESVKAKLTQRAAELCLQKLDKLRAAGHDPVAVIEQSVITGKWTDLYPLRESPPAAPQSKKRFNPSEYVNQNRNNQPQGDGDDNVIDM